MGPPSAPVPSLSSVTRHFLLTFRTTIHIRSSELEVAEDTGVEEDLHQSADTKFEMNPIVFSRFTNLPPELLAGIFDLASPPWEDGPPLLLPLCKRLLSFYYTYLYRVVTVSSIRDGTKFGSCLRSRPIIAHFVKRLILSSPREQPFTIQELLTRLPTVSPPLPTVSSSQSLPSPISYLPALRWLEYDCLNFDLSNLNALTSLPPLLHLSIRFARLLGSWSPSTAISDGMKILSISIVDTISNVPWWMTRAVVDGDMEGGYRVPTEVDLADLVNHFPNLSFLSIKDFESGRSLLPLVQGVRDKIQAVTLSHPGVDLYREHAHSSAASNSALEALRAFPALTSLSIGGPLQFTDIERARSLTNLSYLAFGWGTHAFFGCRTLHDFVSGPSRLPNLRHLVLACVESGHIGHRMDWDEYPRQAELFDLSDWSLPDFRGWKPSEVKKLCRIARRNNVIISGTTLSALAVTTAAQLEYANRIMLRCWWKNSFYIYHNCPSRYSSRLPELDLDALEYAMEDDSIELVKVDLPDEGWFQLIV